MFRRIERGGLRANRGTATGSRASSFLLIALGGIALLATTESAAAAATTQTHGVSAGQVGQIVLGLLVVLAIFGGCTLLLRRLPIIRASRSATLKILEAIPLGTRDRLLLVDAAGTRLLIGVTTGGMTCLHVYNRTAAAATPGDTEFAAQLQNSMQAVPLGAAPKRGDVA
jgi:flagellar protein FliO/FliZ